jgi:hypothetical protein
MTKLQEFYNELNKFKYLEKTLTVYSEGQTHQVGLTHNAYAQIRFSKTMSRKLTVVSYIFLHR